MFCENCGARLTDDEVFCPECGMRQDAASPLIPAKTVCPFCGEALEPDSVFCEYCGKKLTGQSLPSIPDQPSAESANVTSPEKTKPFPLALVIIPAIVLLIFLAVRYGGSIITPPIPDPDTQKATLADFTWVTYDIAHGILPSGLDRLENFEEVEGGWKMYIIDDPDGTYDSPMERLCRCAFGADANGRCIGIRWDYIHNYHTDEGWDDKTSDSFFYGPWDNGVFSGIGPGSITITDFWHANNHEYAVGRMTWPDGIPAVIFLVRP